MTQHQERSKVWRYFTRSSNNLKAKCHLCLAYLSFKGGSISNLHLHLKRKHAEHLDEQNGTLIINTIPDPLEDIGKIEFFREDENVKRLIELVRERGNILFKFSKNNLWNSDLQEQLWKEIAESLQYQVTYTECRQCWRSLRYMYDLYKKGSKTTTYKFLDDLNFLDSLYAKEKTTFFSTIKAKKRKTSSTTENDETRHFQESFLEETGQNHDFDEGMIEMNNIQNKMLNPNENDETQGAEESISFHKNLEEMDDLDFYLGFLNKKMRTLSPDEKSYVQMKFTQLVFEAEAES